MNKLKNILPIALVAFFVLVISILFILSLSGYEIDTGNRTVTRNGIITVKSQPTKAIVTLDDSVLDKTTGLNIDLNEGAHTVSIFKDGYLEWSNIAVVEHSKVVDLTYPLLVPSSLSEQKVLATTNIESSFYDKADDVVYFVGRGRSPQGVNFFTVSSYSIEKSSYITAPSQITIQAESIEVSSLETKLSIEDSMNGLLIIKMLNGEEEEIFGLDSKIPTTTFPISTLYNGGIASTNFIDDNSILVSGADKDLLTVSDWQTSNPVASSIAKEVKVFDLFDEKVVLQLEDSNDIQLISFDEDLVSSVALPNIRGSYKNIYLHQHGNEDNLILESSSSVEGFNLDKITASNPVADPTWSTTLSETSYSSSNNGRFISLSNDKKIFTYDYKLNNPSVAQLDNFIDPSTINWIDGHYFTALATNKDSILLSDFDGKNQYNLESKKEINFSIGLSELRNEVNYIDLNNSIWSYSFEDK